MQLILGNKIRKVNDPIKIKEAEYKEINIPYIKNILYIIFLLPPSPQPPVPLNAKYSGAHKPLWNPSPFRTESLWDQANYRYISSVRQSHSVLLKAQLIIEQS